MPPLLHRVRGLQTRALAYRPGLYFWALMPTLALLEVLALVLLCQVQVHRAQLRDDVERLHDTVVVHCLDQIRALSIGSCRERFAAPP